MGSNNLGLQAGLFTRPQTGDNRGESMMAKHQNALQQVGIRGHTCTQHACTRAIGQLRGAQGDSQVLVATGHLQRLPSQSETEHAPKLCRSFSSCL